MRQGCSLSSFLFNIYIEQAINECKVYCTEIKVNGARIQMLRFADDIAIIAQDKTNLKTELDRLDDILKRNYKMEIDRIKTKVTTCSKDSENINIKMDDDALKQVATIKYLGSIFTEDWKNK